MMKKSCPKTEGQTKQKTDSRTNANGQSDKLKSKKK